MRERLVLEEDKFAEGSVTGARSGALILSDEAREREDGAGVMVGTSVETADEPDLVELFEPSVATGVSRSRLSVSSWGRFCWRWQPRIGRVIGRSSSEEPNAAPCRCLRCNP